MRRLLRVRVRTMIVAVAACSLLFAYVGSYYRLSRRGLREMARYDPDEFLYIPMAEATRTNDLTEHYRLMWIYAPANFLDRHLFRGKRPLNLTVRRGGCE
jgi:hypothetical protein